jgi:hypothetical protein
MSRLYDDRRGLVRWRNTNTIAVADPHPAYANAKAAANAVPTADAVSAKS